MYRVQFLKDTSKAIIREYPKKTLVVFRDGFGYNPPQLQGAEYIEFLEYKKRYITFEPDLIIMVGLNRIITPSNRCDMVNEYLQTMTANTPKISIDTSPFIGEPWRLWYHYSIANCGAFNITYSYALETEWQSWFYRDVDDCRIAGHNIRPLIASTISDLPLLRAEFNFREVVEDESKWYVTAKEAVFEKHNSPKMIINGLLKLANDHFGLDLNYDTYRSGTIGPIPDLGIYRFVVEENIRRLNTYNEVIGYENIHE